MISRFTLLFFILFSVLLGVLLPNQVHALSLEQCTFAYTDSTKNVIASDCQGKLPEGKYTQKAIEVGKKTYTYNSKVNDQGAVDNCSAYITVLSNSNGRTGTIAGTIAEKNGYMCTKVDSSSISIDTTIAKNDTRDVASNKILRSKLTKLVTDSCSSLKSADAISSCNTRKNSAIDTCGNDAFDAANRVGAVGGAGTDASKAYLGNLVPCISGQTGISETNIKKALGPDIYKQVQEAATNANVDECDLDKDGKCVSDEQTTTCGIDGVGWIVCPVMNFMADLNDKALDIIGKSFLNIDPGLLGDDTNSAWKKFRDLANILFVIAFIVIIYSQITGAGISNYGIKKMLPRIVVIAILVNLSFILCQIAVDISNIVGNSISSFISSSLTQGATPGSTGGWKEGTGKVLAVAGGVAVGLVLLVAIGPIALLAFVMIVIILIARKALIILLVVTAPIAFVAYLLPNTQSIFKKWSDLFKALLVIYPIIGLVFGASTLAAGILAKSPDNLVQLSALGVMAIPLLAVPILLKGALAATGALGAKINGGLDRSMKGISQGGKDRLKRRGESLEGRMANSSSGIGRRVGGYRTRRNFGRKSTEIDTAKNQQAALNKHIRANPDSYNQRQLAQAKSDELKEVREEIDREKSTMGEKDHNDLMKIVGDETASTERRAAAAGVIGSRSYRGGHQQLINYLADEKRLDANNELPEAVKDIQQQTAYDMKDAPKGMGDSDRSKLSEGKLTTAVGKNAAGTVRNVSQEMMLARLHAGKMSEETFASLNPDDLTIVKELKTGGHLTPEAQANIDKLIDNLRKPAMAQVYAASKGEAKAVHGTLRS